MPDMPVPIMPDTRNGPNTPPMTPDTPGIWDSPCTPPSTPDPTTLPLPPSTSDPSSPSSTPDPSSTTHRSSTPYPSNTPDPFGIPRTSCLTKDCSSKSSNSALYANGESRNIMTGGDITTLNLRILLHQMNDEKKVKKDQEINTTEPRRMKRRRDESDEFTRSPPKWRFQLNELKEEEEEEPEEELDYS